MPGKRLPVVEDGTLVGIISRHDLLRVFHRPDSDIAAEIEAKLASPLHATLEHQVVELSESPGARVLRHAIQL